MGKNYWEKTRNIIQRFFVFSVWFIQILLFTRSDSVLLSFLYSTAKKLKDRVSSNEEVIAVEQTSTLLCSSSSIYISSISWSWVKSASASAFSWWLHLVQSKYHWASQQLHLAYFFEQFRCKIFACEQRFANDPCEYWFQFSGYETK